MCTNTKGLISLQTMYIPVVNSCVYFESICKLSFTCLDDSSPEAMSLEKKCEYLDVIFKTANLRIMSIKSVFHTAERIPPRRRQLLMQVFAEGYYKQYDRH